MAGKLSMKTYCTFLLHSPALQSAKINCGKIVHDDKRAQKINKQENSWSTVESRQQKSNQTVLMPIFKSF